MHARLIRIAATVALAASLGVERPAFAGSPAAAEAISRSFTVVNAVDTSARDAISRSFSLVNAVGAPVAAGGISRAATVINYIAPPPTESISRSVSVCLRPALGADVDGDGDGDMDDIELFVVVLLDKDSDFVTISRADVSIDCSTNALDIQHFVQSLLEQ